MFIASCEEYHSKRDIFELLRVTNIIVKEIFSNNGLVALYDEYHGWKGYLVTSYDKYYGWKGYFRIMSLLLHATNITKYHGEKEFF